MRGAEPARSPGERAAAALELVARDPAEALAEADAVVATARRDRSPESRSARAVAHRAAGLALREIGDAGGARARLRLSIRSARSAGDSVTETDATISLAFVETEAGRTRSAAALLGRAASATTDVPAVRLLTTRALLHQRTGHHAEALADYDAAFVLAHRIGDPVRLARLHNNRAMALAYVGRTADAVDDLEHAARLYLAAGASPLAADAIANQAWVVGMAGDVAGALRLYDRSYEVARDVDHAERWTDRAEVYLRAGMPVDAARSAARAVRWLDGRGWGAAEAEALLLLARCQLEAGDPSAAQGAADRASRQLRSQGRTGWAPVAAYVAVRARTAEGVAPAQVQTVLDVAHSLEAAGWRLPSLDLRVTAAARAAAAGDDAVARALLPTEAPVRVPELAARAHLALALRHELDGDLVSARRSARLGFAAIEQRRALLGATEMRAHASTLAVDVVDVGVRLALRAGSPRELFTWAENGRAAVFRHRPARPVEDAQLRENLTRLRWAARAAEDARLEGRTDEAAEQEVRSRQAQVLRITRRSGGAAPTPAATQSDVRALVGGGAFAHIVAHRGRALSVTVTSGRTSIADHGELSDIQRLVRRASTGLRRAVTGGRTDERAYELLDAALGRRLSAAAGEGRLVLSPPPELGALPWGALPSLRDRPFSLVPSARSWVSSRSVHPATASIGAAAGPGLPGAARESDEVAAPYAVRSVLSGAAATADAVLGLMNRHDVVHIAAHGHLRSDNPLFSTLELADGPLTAYDLELLAQVPSLVVLSCCHAGTGAAVAHGESLGLATTLLRIGCRSVVAPVVELADDDAVDVMSAFHRRVAAGEDVSAALAAVRAASSGPAATTLVAFGA